MSEFNNRIKAQRDILVIVNGVPWREQLFGLSSGAIDRWISENQLQSSDAIVGLIHRAAEKLFFLSNKSQEQVTEEYGTLSDEILRITAQIAEAVRCMAP